MLLGSLACDSAPGPWCAAHRARPRRGHWGRSRLICRVHGAELELASGGEVFLWRDEGSNRLVLCSLLLICFCKFRFQLMQSPIQSLIFAVLIPTQSDLFFLFLFLIESEGQLRFEAGVVWIGTWGRATDKY